MADISNINQKKGLEDDYHELEEWLYELEGEISKLTKKRDDN